MELLLAKLMIVNALGMQGLSVYEIKKAPTRSELLMRAISC